MTKERYYLIPGAFFLMAAAANLAGRLMGNPLIASMVKPALMPLLALTAVCAEGSFQNKEIKLLVTALLFGCMGDIFLIADGFIPFVCGIAAFLTGHIFYLKLFGGKSWKGLGLKVWIPAAVVMAAMVVALIKIIGIKGAMLAPMAIYGSVLMLLIFSGLAGAVRYKTADWWIILCGTVLFTISDSMIAIGAFGTDFPGREAAIMFTYIVAQSLLAAGTLKRS